MGAVDPLGPRLVVAARVDDPKARWIDDDARRIDGETTRGKEFLLEEMKARRCINFFANGTEDWEHGIVAKAGVGEARIAETGRRKALRQKLLGGIGEPYRFGDRLGKDDLAAKQGRTPVERTDGLCVY
jgi:hypothetical protein